MFTSPCEWPVTFSGCAVPETWTALGEEGQADYIAAATEFLWRWTGQVLGLCEVTVRPCRIDLSEPSTFEGRGPYGHGTTAPWRPVLVQGKWFNIGCGSCGFNDCGCDGPTVIRLPGPVDSVTTVTIDGDVLDPSAYRVEGNRLIRQDGDVWPFAQNLSLPDSEVGTWSVVYDRGTPVPIGGQIAAGVLAIELFKAACDDTSCGLPKRFQSITRQGVTVAMLDSFDDIDKGHTGIYLIDSWVASVTQTPRRAAVFSPDLPRGARAF
jgi:hypothetical protein